MLLPLFSATDPAECGSKDIDALDYDEPHQLDLPPLPVSDYDDNTEFTDDDYEGDGDDDDSTNNDIDENSSEGEDDTDENTDDTDHAAGHDVPVADVLRLGRTTHR